MTKLDMAIERLRALPPEEQESLAEEIFSLLEDDDADVGLTPEQEAALERRLTDPNRKFVPHEEVFARLNARLSK